MTTAAPSQLASAPHRVPPPTFQQLGAEWLQASEARARVRFMPGHDLAVPAGLLQGGTLSPCLDVITGSTVSSLRRDGFVITVLTSVSCLWKTGPGRVLVGEARAERAGRQHLNVEARLVPESAGTEVGCRAATCLFQHGVEL